MNPQRQLGEALVRDPSSPWHLAEPGSRQTYQTTTCFLPWQLLAPKPPSACGAAEAVGGDGGGGGRLFRVCLAALGPQAP